jgi:hypothetical protein
MASRKAQQYSICTRVGPGSISNTVSMRDTAELEGTLQLSQKYCHPLPSSFPQFHENIESLQKEKRTHSWKSHQTFRMHAW